MVKVIYGALSRPLQDLYLALGGSYATLLSYDSPQTQVCHHRWRFPYSQHVHPTLQGLHIRLVYKKIIQSSLQGMLRVVWQWIRRLAKSSVRVLVCQTIFSTCELVSSRWFYVADESACVDHDATKFSSFPIYTICATLRHVFRVARGCWCKPSYALDVITWGSLSRYSRHFARNCSDLPPTFLSQERQKPLVCWFISQAVSRLRRRHWNKFLELVTQEHVATGHN